MRFTAFNKYIIIFAKGFIRIFANDLCNIPEGKSEPVFSRNNIFLANTSEGSKQKNLISTSGI